MNPLFFLCDCIHLIIIYSPIPCLPRLHLIPLPVRPDLDGYGVVQVGGCAGSVTQTTGMSSEVRRQMQQNGQPESQSCSGSTFPIPSRDRPQDIYLVSGPACFGTFYVDTPNKVLRQVCEASSTWGKDLILRIPLSSIVVGPLNPPCIPSPPGHVN